MTDDQRHNMIETAIKVAKEFGLPVVMLAVTVYLFREAAVSVHQTVLLPMVKSHTEFISSTQETLREIGRAQDKQADTLHEIAEGQRDIRRAIGISGSDRKAEAK